MNGKRTEKEGREQHILTTFGERFSGSYQSA